MSSIGRGSVSPRANERSIGRREVVSCQFGDNFSRPRLRLKYIPCTEFFEHAVCHRNPYGIEYLIILLPFWIRFVQCIRRCFDTRQVSHHLANAGKYATAFAVIATAIVAKRDPTTINHALHLVALFIATAYRLAWDILMDWGLLDQNWQETNPLLREQLLYRYCIGVNHTDQ